MQRHSTESDRVLIVNLGGAAKVARMLGYRKEGGTQRVHNWMSRGIPAAVKVAHPRLFLPELVANMQEPDRAAA